MLSLSLSCRQELALTGGWTTIFPQAEALLEETDYRTALASVCRRRSMNQYHSVMDFLFCELFLQFKMHCQRYYKGTGPLLQEILSAEQIAEYDTRLVRALQIAREHPQFLWTRFRLLVIQ